MNNIKLRKRRRITLIIAAILLVLAAILYCLHAREPRAALPAEDINHYGVYQYEGGRIFIEARTTLYTMNKSMMTVWPDADAQALDITVYRPLWPFARRQTPPEDALRDNPLAPLAATHDTTQHLMSTPVTMAADGALSYHGTGRDGRAYDIPITAIRIGNSEDGYVPIWQEGEPLPHTAAGYIPYEDMISLEIPEGAAP